MNCRPNLNWEELLPDTMIPGRARPEKVTVAELGRTEIGPNFRTESRGPEAVSLYGRVESWSL